MAEDIADVSFEASNVTWTANILDKLPEVGTFFGLDLNIAAYVIAALCIVQPVFYGCTAILPLSYLLMSIWVLVVLFSVNSFILLTGIAQGNPLLMTIWIWYALFFVVIMCLMMLLMSCVFCSRGQWTRLIIVLFYLLWYSFTVYCILAINDLRQNTENSLEMGDKIVDKEVVAELPSITTHLGHRWRLWSGSGWYSVLNPKKN